MGDAPVSMWQTSPDIPYPYTLEILSPVHIGCDEEISPNEYFVDGQELVLCDLESMFRDPTFDADAYTRFIVGGTAPYLGDFSSGIAKKHPMARLKLDCGRLTTPYPAIKKHIRTGGKPYIPGSSIKGSIRSALLYHGLNKQAEKSHLREAIKACLLRDFQALKRLSRSGELGRYTVPLNYVEDGNYHELLTRIGQDYYLKEGIDLQKLDLDFASLLEVSDTHVGYENVKTAVYASKVAGTRRQMPAYYEAMVPGQDMLFTVKSLGYKYPQRDLFNIVNNFSLKLSKMDFMWYEEKGLSGAAEFTKKMLEKIRELKHGQKKVYPIRIGQGSGSVSTSLLTLSRDFGVVEEYVKAWKVTGHLTEDPKTRKMLIDGRENEIPMGWALIRPYEAEKDE